LTGFGRILDDLNGAGVRYVLIGSSWLSERGVRNPSWTTVSQHRHGSAS
jgi:hypothetical protein